MKRKLHEYEIRKILTAVIIAALVVFVIIVFVRGDLTVEKILSYTPKQPFLAALFLIILYAFKSITIVFPVSVLHIAAGMIFSPFYAIVVNMLGTFLSLFLMYFVGYRSPTGKIDKKIESYPKLKKAVEVQKGNDWFLCYFLRIISCLPFDAVSVYLGYLKIPFFTYAVSSMAGTLPGLIASTLIGTSIKDPASPMFIISVCVVVLLAVLSFVLYTLKIKIKNKKS